MDAIDNLKYELSIKGLRYTAIDILRLPLEKSRNKV